MSSLSIADPVARGYSRVQIALHWAIVVLIVVAWQLSGGMRHAPGTPAPEGVPLHVIAGVTILALMVARLALRIVRPVPAAPGSSGLVRKAADAVHWLLYALIIMLPLSGLAAFADGIEAAGDVHEVLWSALLVVTGLHVAAALYHHFVLHDNVVRRMVRPTSVGG